MISVRGNQVFSFPIGFMLGAGENVTVTSGPNAKQGTGFLRWTSDSVWNNNDGPGGAASRSATRLPCVEWPWCSSDNGLRDRCAKGRKSVAPNPIGETISRSQNEAWLEGRGDLSVENPP